MNFTKKLKTLNKKINSEIKKFFLEKKKEHESTKKYFSILEEFVLNGGKRLRPSALIMAYKGCGGGKNVIRESLSVEFFHNSTLIEDDVMDEDELRRKKPTVYKVFKNEHLKSNKEKKYDGSLFNKESNRLAVSKAILMGNILYSYGEKCLSSSKIDAKAIKKAINIYSEAFIKVNEGQLLDLSFESKTNVSEKEYLEMAKKKSAWLVMASIRIGAELAGAKQNQIKALSKYALNTTLAFQIQDDLMDISSEMNKGHGIGSDIKKGKKTLLVVKTLELCKSRDKKSLLKALGSNNDRKAKKAIKLLHDYGSVDYCKTLAKKKVSAGKNWLRKAKLANEAEEFFLELADFVIERKI